MEWKAIVEHVIFNFKVKIMSFNTLTSNIKVNISQTQVTIGKAKSTLK